MAKIDLPYIQAFKDRHGRQRYYYRRGRVRVALPNIADPAFMAAYAAAKAQDPAEIGAKAVKAYSISALIAAYYKTAEFQRLEDSSKTTYRNMVERFRAKYGDRSAVTIQTKHLDAIFDGMSETPGAAKNLRKRLRRIFRRAVKMGWRPDNPIVATDAPEVFSEGFVPWSEGDIERFEVRWAPGTRQRRALYLLLYTGVRRSNVVGLGRQHIQGARIRFTVLKGRKRTPTTLSIPIHSDLRAELDLAPPGLSFILTEHEKPFSGPGFTNWFVEQAKLAGLHGRTPHGLRKSAARRLAEAGCTEKEIAAITGHRTLAEVARYTRDANQVKLADRAHAKLRGEK